MTTPLRIGILGAAGITPNSLIAPAAGNPSVGLTAVAARNRARAEEFAAAHGIARVLDAYEDVLADPDIDAVYIPLPNSSTGAGRSPPSTRASTYSSRSPSPRIWRRQRPLQPMSRSPGSS